MTAMSETKDQIQAAMHCPYCGGSHDGGFCTSPYAGLSVDKLLDLLPVLALVVSDGGDLKDASDAELRAWVYGINGAADNVKQIITAWRIANAAR